MSEPQLPVPPAPAAAPSNQRDCSISWVIAGNLTLPSCKNERYKTISRWVWGRLNAHAPSALPDTQEVCDKLDFLSAYFSEAASCPLLWLDQGSWASWQFPGGWKSQPHLCVQKCCHRRMAPTQDHYLKVQY